MLGWLIETGQRLRLLVVVLALGIVGLGAWQLPDAPKEVLPEFGPVYVEIQTEALGLSAEEVEHLITVPLEQNLLNGVAWLEDIRSQSITGLSSIVLVFEQGTDPLRARQMVAERLTQTAMLPQVSKPPTMLQPLSSASRVIMVRLSSTDLTPVETSVLARWKIRPALMGVTGVANVSIWGQREQQLQVQVDPKRLHDRGVKLEDVIATTGNSLWVSPLTFLEASAPGTGGFIDTPNQRLGVQHLLPISSPEELARVPIEGCTTSYAEQTAAGTAVCPTLGDVATVVEHHQPLIGDSVAAEGESLLLVIEKFPDANTEAVTEGVRDTLSDMAPGLAGVTIDSTIFERANLIDSAIANISNVLIIGLVLAVVILFLLLLDWRSALIAAIAIPLSLLVAALVLHLRGATFNTVIVGGLIATLGILIDDVVIDVENIRRRLRQHRTEGESRSTTSIIASAIVESRGPILPAMALILLATLPVLFLGGLFDAFFLDGQSGSFFQPVVVSYALAILASLAVSMIVTPTLATLLFSRTSATPSRSPLLSKMEHQFSRVLRRLVSMDGLAMASVAVLLAIGLAMLPQLREPDSIVPTARDRDLLVTWDATSGTSLTEMTRITSRISSELKTVPGVANVGAHVGRALTSDQVVDVNSGELWVSIKPDAHYDDTVAAVNEVVQGYPGLDHEVQTYLDSRLASAQTSPDDVVLRIYGQDRDVLLKSAQEVKGILDGIDGVQSSRIDVQVQEPQMQVEVDLAAAQTHGLLPGEVRRTAATLVTGIEVGSLFEDQKVFEVMVVGVPATRQSVTAIQNILVDTPGGTQVRLGDVAAVTLAPGEDSIRHDAVSRYIDVVANVDGRSNSAVASDLETGIAGVVFPFEYHAEVLSDRAEGENAERRLGGLALATVIGLFLVLQAIFSSWRVATLAFVILPTAMVGGVFMIWVRDEPVTIGALLGLLAVFALAARASITLISNYQRLEREEGMAFGPDLIVQGTRERFTPILVTTCTTALALAPFAFAGSRPGLEVAQPMAVVMLGGLVTFALVNLLLVPSLCLRFTSSARPDPVTTHPMGLETTGTAAD